jgi:hypothetical protein
MTLVTIPFFLRTKPSKGGSRRFGWVDVDVEVRDVEPATVEHAVRIVSVLDREQAYFNVGDRYIHDGTFFQNAHNTFARATKKAFQAEALAEEVRYENVPQRERRSITGVFSSTLLKKLGHHRVEAAHSRKISSVGAVDPLCITAAENWAKSHLVFADGVLLENTNPVSVVMESGLGWNLIDSAGDISWCVHGLTSGLHYPYPSHDFLSMKSKCLRKAGVPDKFREMNSKLIQSEVNRTGKRDQYAVAGGAAYNVGVLSRVSDDFHFEARSLVSTARAISSDLLGSRSAYAKTSWGTTLRSIEREHGELGANLFDREDVLDELCVVLDQIPRALFGEYASFVLDRVLERYSDRSVIAPSCGQTREI